MQLNNKQIRKLNEFIEQYKGYYSESIQEMLINFDGQSDIVQYDFMLQIYSYLFPDAFANEYNLYTMFYKYLRHRFPNAPSKKILEVASGYLPGLSIILREKFKRKMNVSCIDPKALPIKINGITITRANFTVDTDTSDIDLIIANCPCDAFDVIVDSILINPKEICIQTCPCRKEPFYSLWEFHYYLDYQTDRLMALKDLGYEVYRETTEASDITMAPAFSVLKRKYPKIKYHGINKK